MNPLEKLITLTYVDCDGGEKQSELSGYISAKELIYYDSTNNVSEDGKLIDLCLCYIRYEG